MATAPPHAPRSCTGRPTPRPGEASRAHARTDAAAGEGAPAPAPAPLTRGARVRFRGMLRAREVWADSWRFCQRHWGALTKTSGLLLLPLAGIELLGPLLRA